MPLAGALITTFLAPALMWLSKPAFSAVAGARKTPVLSRMMSAPSSPHGNSAGLRTAIARIFLPETVMFSSSYSTVPG